MNIKSVEELRNHFIAGIIPARGGSKGVPRKNIRRLMDKPLVQYTIDAAKVSKHLSCFAVSTEDAEIASIVKSAGAMVIDRPYDLAKDDSPTLPSISHAVSWLEEQYQRRLDYIIILQATTPLRTGNDIDNAIEKLLVSGADSVVSVCAVTHFHPSKLKKIIDNRLLPYLENEIEGTRRQDLPPVYIRNGGIYAVRRTVIMDEKSIFGKDCRPYIMPIERSVEIDSEFDFKIAELMLQES